MTFSAKAMADGQVSDSQAAIYTTPASTTAYVKSITLYNTSSTEQTVQLFINRSGTARAWKRFVLAEDEHADVIGAATSIILEAADTIEAVTTTAAVVDYTVSGVEET